jgi:hypothetical protein
MNNSRNASQTLGDDICIAGRDERPESAARINDPYKQLAIETAANRLVLRALLMSLFASGGDRGRRLARAVVAAAEAMAPQALRLDGLDNKARREAVELLRKRWMAVLAEFAN